MDFQTFVGGHDSYIDKNINCEELVNFYPERVPGGRKGGQFVLRASEGSKTVSTFKGIIRGFYACSRGFRGINEQALVIVSGEEVYYVQPKYSEDSWEWIRVGGFLESETGIVSICDNGYQIFICDSKEYNGFVSGNGYYIDFGLDTNSPEPEIRKIDNSDMPVYPIKCTQIGPYTCITGPQREGFQDAQTSSRFYFSNIAGITDTSRPVGKQSGIWFDGNRFEGSVSFFSPMRNLVGIGSLLWIFGDTGYEAWQATGNWRQEFQRVPSAFSSGKGILAENSLRSNGKQIFWLGSGEMGNAIVYMLESGSIEAARISLNSMEEAWNGYVDLRQAIGAVFSKNGHVFYSLTFPETEETYVYDAMTGAWHKRNFYDNIRLLKWKPSFTQTVRDSIYGCTLGENKVYKLVEPGLGDDGKPIYRKRVSPCYNAGLMRSVHYELMLDLQSGREYKDNQQTMFKLRCSDDGGHTWSADMIQRNGRRGEYEKALQFRRLGQARKRVYELSMVDPVGINIAGARLTTQLSSMRL
jgi:hypothetical protein